MSVVEMLLRLGCSLVAWMVVYAYCIWLATLRVIGCGPDGDELWRLLLGFAPLVVGFAFLLTAIRPLADIARILRWFAMPLVILVPLAAMPVVAALGAHTLNGRPICGLESVAWHGWWAPLQIVALLVLVWRGLLAVR